MPEYLSPGVYVEEIEIGPKPIEGVSTSTAGFLGETERGPTLPQPIASWLDYQRLFGDYFGSNKYLPYEVEGFFTNGGQRCYVARIVKATASKAYIALHASQDAIAVNAIGEGSWGNRVAVKISQGTASGTFKLSAFYWKKMPASLFDPELDTKTIPRPSAAESFDNLSLDPSSPDFYVAKVNALSNLVRIDTNSQVPASVPSGFTGTAQSFTSNAVVLAQGTPSSLVTDDLWIEVIDQNGQKQIQKVVSYTSSTLTASIDANAAWKINTSGACTYVLYWVQHLKSGADDLFSSEASVIALDQNPAYLIKLGKDASSVDDFYKGAKIEVDDGQGHTQNATITAYNGKAKIAVVGAKWNPIPDGTYKFTVTITEAQGTVVKLAVNPEQRVNLGPTVLVKDYTGMTIVLDDGQGNTQTRKVTAYDQSSQTATVDSQWNTVPDENWTYTITSNYVGSVASPIFDPTNSVNLGKAADFTGKTIVITSGTGKDQQQPIVSTYVDSTTQNSIAQINGQWTTAPNATSMYQIESPNPTLTIEDYKRTDTNTPGQKQGLTAFEEIEDISIIYSPNAKDLQDLPGVLIDHCENLKDRFAIIDSKLYETTPITPPADSKYAAFYYPWISITDPVSNSLILVPPGGYIAGIYARTDNDRGVFKAPANEVVEGADSIQFIISKGMQDLLNPIGVNCIRIFNGNSIKVWGARTMSTDPLWKYINVRRLFIFLEKSIEEATQWVVFEPNNEKLWARVKQTISQFLTTQWKSGALMGTTPEEAFFVKCDRTTMTQDDIDNGRLIVVIGVAPTKPAEFVIFRIAQWQGGSAATE